MIQYGKYSQSNDIKHQASLDKQRASVSGVSVKPAFSANDIKKLMGKVAPINGVPAKVEENLDIQNIR